MTNYARTAQAGSNVHRGEMARNPTWSRDELILALDLYLRHRESLPDSDGPECLRDFAGDMTSILDRLLAETCLRSSHPIAQPKRVPLLQSGGRDGAGTKELVSAGACTKRPSRRSRSVCRPEIAPTIQARLSRRVTDITGRVSAERRLVVICHWPRRRGERTCGAEHD
jgi:hypothetical protein